MLLEYIPYLHVLEAKQWKKKRRIDEYKEPMLQWVESETLNIEKRMWIDTNVSINLSN